VRAFFLKKLFPLSASSPHFKIFFCKEQNELPPVAVLRQQKNNFKTPGFPQQSGLATQFVHIHIVKKLVDRNILMV